MPHKADQIISVYTQYYEQLYYERHIMAQAKDEKSKLKVGFFGEGEGGKTQLVQALLGKEFSKDYVTTTGVAFNSAPSNIKGGALDIAEMGGAIRYDALIPTYAKQFGEDISVICIDQSNSYSLERAKTYIEGVKRGNPDAQIIIAVTKTDLPSQISEEDIEKLREQYKITSTPVKTSAKNGEGIEELRESIYRLSLEKDREKIEAFSKKVQQTIDSIKKLKIDNYDPKNSPAFQALNILKEKVDKADGKEAVRLAIDEFTRTVNKNTLKVEPPDVRRQITRFFEALFNWDRSYFADNAQEKEERTRFSQQTSLKEQLTSFKEETEEEKNKFSP